MNLKVNVENSTTIRIKAILIRSPESVVIELSPLIQSSNYFLNATDMHGIHKTVMKLKVMEF